jgi:hypothetical protein
MEHPCDLSQRYRKWRQAKAVSFKRVHGIVLQNQLRPHALLRDG